MAQKYPGRRYYTMYHGTTVPAAKSIIKYGFRVSTGGTLGRGVYVSRDLAKAQAYPACTSEQKVVLKLSVRVGKVKKIDCGTYQHTWHDHGYDSAWLPAEFSPVGREEDCVYDPRRIRVVDAFNAPPQDIQALRQLIQMHKR